MSGRTAVVLFNLGGPDRPEAVKPFLTNLFSDPAILRIPGPLRWVLARYIAARRAPVAAEIYRRLGGRSPILEGTSAQAEALAAALGEDARVFVCMRYWHPMADEVTAAVKAFDPARIVLLPLYPQFSSTTTASSFRAWEGAAARAGLRAWTTRVCCYPDQVGLVDSIAGLTREAIAQIPAGERMRILFSAHGLPKRVVDGGDPYRRQVERTVAAVLDRLDGEPVDSVVCYQSRVGRLEWIGPYTDAEIERAGGDGISLVVAPVAFVSEHSETLVELDIEYARLAERSGVPAYVRVPTVGATPAFIAGLARLVEQALADGGDMLTCRFDQRCPAAFTDCPLLGGSQCRRAA